MRPTLARVHTCTFACQLAKLLNYLGVLCTRSGVARDKAFFQEVYKCTQPDVIVKLQELFTFVVTGDILGMLWKWGIDAAPWNFSFRRDKELQKMATMELFYAHGDSSNRDIFGSGKRGVLLRIILRMLGELEWAVSPDLPAAAFRAVRDWMATVWERYEARPPLLPRSRHCSLPHQPVPWAACRHQLVTADACRRLSTPRSDLKLPTRSSVRRRRGRGKL